ncbi:MAG TPA: hypothetical protein VKR52_15105 [Terracidiphilus sp.]|nr:hypothetical protein [Terracidiphilus sp.]
MNFTQMHDNLRAILLRRIERGTLSVTLLARQIEKAPSHISNFLHGRGNLSNETMDLILIAQHLSAEDLLPARNLSAAMRGDSMPIAVVSHHVAMFEPIIRDSAWQDALLVSAVLLEQFRTGDTCQRGQWDRFVAVRLSALDAAPMDPLILPDATAVLDRHYTSFQPYRGNLPTLYAVRVGTRLVLRYVDFIDGRLVLRPRELAFPVRLLEAEPGRKPDDLIVGRVVLVMNEA